MLASIKANRSSNLGLPVLNDLFAQACKKAIRPSKQKYILRCSPRCDSLQLCHLTSTRNFSTWKYTNEKRAVTGRTQPKNEAARPANPASKRKKEITAGMRPRREESKWYFRQYQLQAIRACCWYELLWMSWCMGRWGKDDWFCVLRASSWFCEHVSLFWFQVMVFEG